MSDDIHHIEFGVLSASEIRALSVVEVTCHDILEKGLPKHNGLADLRLGTIDRQFRCHTCKCSAVECPGHYGHIELHTPVYHINFIKTVGKILQTICVKCSKCKYVGNNNPNEKGSKLFKSISDNAKTKLKCPFCDEVQPKIIVDKHEIFLESAQERKNLSAGECLQILNNMTDETIKSIGFSINNKPVNMIFEVLLVPPPHVRPSVNMDSALRSQDDLTHKLSEIVKTNNILKKTDKTTSSYQSLCELLQYHITTYIDNNVTGIAPATQRTGRPIKSITQRLKSKEGRIRGNLMGKRVNFSARTVITAEPDIDLDELGVPWEIATTLTYPDIVTKYNIKILQNYVNNGPTPIFGVTGANFIIHNGITKDLRFVKNVRVEIGDTVVRHLKDGDVVIFNRQPSLHKMSMMGHKIKIMKHSTFRMNVCATTPYNADFDGDEMNLHAPQSYTTRTEIKEIMMVSNNIVSPQSNKPVIGIIQDALLASFKMTHKNVLIREDVVFDMIMKMNKNIKKKPIPAILKPHRMYTGKQVFEMLVPDNFYFERKGAIGKDEKSYYDDDGKVIIKNGIFLCGTLCKKSLGTSEGGIIHLLWLEYSKEIAKDFISNLQYIANYWLVRHGFSIGAMDIFPDETTEQLVRSVLQDSKLKVEQIIKICNAKQFDVTKYESKINQTLNNAMSQAGLIVKNNLPDCNNINATVTGGSKGSMFNIAQIMGCVGQQNVSGKRINFGYINRVLPHFEKHDNGPEAKGFVENSYKNGLKPHEFFYHAMGGREGIIDTAIKTSETGYIQRRLIKAMEDLKISYDGSLRNAMGDIIQFIYGGDALNPTYVRNIKINYIKPFSENFNEKYNNIHNIDEVNKIATLMDKLQYTRNIKLPFNITRMLQMYSKNDSDNLVSFDYASIQIQKLIDDINQFYYYFHDTASFYLEIYIRTELCTKTICKLLTVLQFDTIINRLLKLFRQSLVEHGEMVGTIAAQSIGEPCTQLTLNTFHAAGISAKNVTLGVPRFKELINVAKVLKSPSMTLQLKPENMTQSQCENLSCDIEQLLLSDFIINCSICDISSINDDYFEIPNDIEHKYFQYGIKYICNKQKLSDSKITFLDITVKLMMEYEALHCIGIENECALLIAVYNDEDITLETIKMLNSKLRTEQIKGIYGITKVYINPEFTTLETDGTCLEKLLSSNDFDICNSFSNDITEVKIHFGIEAARSILLSEIQKVIEFDGTYVNKKHFLTLVDVMTYKGGLMSITRHGINKSENGPLMKCSFEETVDVLADAATYSEFDMIKGVTESITLGKIAKIGSGNIDIMYDYEQFSNKQNNSIPNTISEIYTPLDVNSDEDYLSSYFSDDEFVESFF
uniref:DNA-directed RNA polymerase II subunit RPB1 n=1 Tax=viral metagenome TaxID=1070528 RepID=A0A6C0F607_9ZZZZ|tara:strand:+ start:10065 stop:14123 length:4059 start_codon:yes stop_codon:yes gene_type:complete